MKVEIFVPFKEWAGYHKSKFRPKLVTATGERDAWDRFLIEYYEMPEQYSAMEGGVGVETIRKYDDNTGEFFGWTLLWDDPRGYTLGVSKDIFSTLNWAPDDHNGKDNL